ncbi:MAG: tungsten formylmethanofuran dehydrogenase [Ignavibacteriae bacterium]|nr:MAG: tungsten formylmethanofuran dehydrogenase [Ignavibacteriota bacterium]
MAEKIIKDKQRKTNGIAADENGQEKRGKSEDQHNGLSEPQLIHAYKSMLLSRFVDDRIDTLIKQGKATFLISGSGHEAVQVACAMAMKGGKDWFFTYYRDNSIGTALGITAKDIFRHIMGKATDTFTGGRQMPMHLGSKELRMPTASSPTGSQYLQAVGAALSCVYRETDEVAYVGGGEGSTSEGEYFEAINWAARAKLPVLFCIQNNRFAISVPIEQQTAGGSVYKVSSGFEGLHRFHIDGTDFLECYKTAKEAVRLARNGEGPSLIYADVVRLRSHSASDAQEKYRTKEEIDRDRLKDPIVKLEKYLLENKIISEIDIEEIRKEINDDVVHAADEIYKEANPDPADIEKYLFCPPEEQTKIEYEASTPSGQPIVMVDAINHALHEEMEKNPDMLIYGEDIQDGKGGVFTATKGLSTKYGTHRVFNSPLAEASIVGTAIGAALTGLKPVVEIQFADYIFPAMMQLRDELVMYRYRSNNAFPAPVTIRVAVGGYIGGGHYHSQNIEAIFAKCPGLYIAYPSNAADAKGLLKTACQLKDPVMFMEHKFLYRQGYAKSPEPDANYYLPFGKAAIKKEGSDLTIVTYGAMVEKALRASRELEKKGMGVEVIDIRTIVPLDMETILNSVKKTGKVIVFHEDTKFMGFGAEIASQIAEEAFQYLDAPVKRVAGLHIHIPFHPNLEKTALPQDEWILKASEEMLNY